MKKMLLIIVGLLFFLLTISCSKKEDQAKAVDAFKQKGNTVTNVKSGSNVIMINSDTDMDLIIEKSKSSFVLIDLYADWCAPCRMLGPILEEISVSESSNVTIYKINVDKHPRIAQMFKVSSIPLVIGMKNGIPVESILGVRSKSEYLSIIEKYKF